MGKVFYSKLSERLTFWWNYWVKPNINIFFSTGVWRMYLSVAVCVTSSLVVLLVAALALRTHFLMVDVINNQHRRRSSHGHLISRKKNICLHISARDVKGKVSRPSEERKKCYGLPDEDIWKPQSIPYNHDNNKDVITNTDISSVHCIVTSCWTSWWIPICTWSHKYCIGEHNFSYVIIE